ncbi:MAG: DNA repair protein RecO [Dehalococcoidia bacterium]|nr:DNA repair protein RecO [Dehalococcoidia bacterium]
MAERPRTYTAEGVILRRRNIGEADSIFTVYSDREGKFDAVARGVRKTRSKMRGHLEPLTRSRFLIAKGRSLDVFAQAETVHHYRAVREDLDRAATAVYCAELVDRFTAERAPQEGLYSLLLGILDALEDGCGITVARYFEVQLLALSGYDLALDACALCTTPLAAEDTLLSPSAGGLVCRLCRPQAEGGRILGVRAVKVLRYARRATLDAFAALNLDPDLDAELRTALALVIRHTLERDLAATRFLEDVRRLPGPHPAPSPDGRVE